MEDELGEESDQLSDLPGTGGLDVRHLLEDGSGELRPGGHEERHGGPDIHDGRVAADQSGREISKF